MQNFLLAGLVGLASSLAAPIPATVTVDGTVSNGASLEHFWSKGVRTGFAFFDPSDLSRSTY